MANLTLRSVKGSPLTNAELDGNFEYFTGSHAITGSLILTSGITTSGSILISGSIIPNVSSTSVTSSFSLGSATNAWKDIYVSNGTITFLNGAGQTQSTLGAGSSGTVISGSLTISGSTTSTGGFTGSLLGTATTASYISPTFISASAAASGFGSGGGSSIATGSFATTGSNTFIDNQVISGSTSISGSINHVGSLKTGISNNVALNNSLANGFNVSASGEYSHAGGYFVNAKADYSHGEGYFSTAGLSAWNTNGTFSGVTQLPSSVGNITSSFIPGATVILGNNYLTVSRSFFQSNLTQIQYVSASSLSLGGGTALAIIDVTNPLATYPNQTLSAGNRAHAEGNSTIALFGHSEGGNTVAFGLNSHAEGFGAKAIGEASHAEGYGTIASGDFQHVEGQFNTLGDTTSLLIVGNGTDPDYGGTRSNAFKVRMSGSIVLPTTQSAAPSWTGADGEMVFATVTGNHRFYVWMSGAWRSGSLV
jgi:hypothetical protein